MTKRNYHDEPETEGSASNLLSMKDGSTCSYKMSFTKEEGFKAELITTRLGQPDVVKEAPYIFENAGEVLEFFTWVISNTLLHVYKMTGIKPELVAELEKAREDAIRESLNAGEGEKLKDLLNRTIH